MTNTNRQVQMGRKALPLPGEARQDLWIIQDLAQRIGCNWNYKHVGEVFTEMASMMPALDNITWDRVEREDHVTYPVDGPDVPGRDVVFDKGIPRPNGLAKLVATKFQAPDEMPDAEYPFILTTGRQLEHWHTGAMTRRASMLDALEPGPVAWLSRGTIAKLGIKPGDTVRVSTRRGVVELDARQDEVGAGRRRVHPVRLCRGGGEPADQSGARPVRQDPRVQVLRRQARAGGAGEPHRGRVGTVPLPLRLARRSVISLYEVPQTRYHPPQPSRGRRKP